MKLKALMSVIALSILCPLLVGCGNSNRPSAKDPVTLTMWHNYGGDMQQSMDVLIDEFNSTIGQEQGIVIDVTAISSSSELNESLNMIVNGDPGAPEMPVSGKRTFMQAGYLFYRYGAFLLCRCFY